MQNLMLRLGMEEDVPIESKMITKRIAAAQKAVEAQNFASRKHILEYDDVMNKQRQAVYGMRRALLEGQDQKERILEMIEGILAAFIDARCPEKTHSSQLGLARPRNRYPDRSSASRSAREELQNLDRRQMEEDIHEQLVKSYQEKEDMIGAELMRETERMIMLNVIDNQWKDHLLSMDHLKEGIGLRGYGQKDPLIEYKKESYVLFQDMMDRIEDETIRYLFFMQRAEAPVPAGRAAIPRSWPDDPEDGGRAGGRGGRSEPSHGLGPGRAELGARPDAQHPAQEGKRAGPVAVRRRGSVHQEAARAGESKAGRNDPCPCGSGKKYKKCCGAA